LDCRRETAFLTDHSRRCSSIAQYSTPDSAGRAIRELNDSDLNGRSIFVREDRESGGKGSGGGKGNGGGKGSGSARPVFVGSSGGNGSGSGCSVFVGNLSWDVKWQDLKDHMRQAGDVIQCDVMEEASGRSKGCGIATYATAGEAQTAISSLHDTELNGRLILVREDGGKGKGTGGKGTGGKGKGTGGKGFGGKGGRGGGNGGYGGGGGSEVGVFVGNITQETSWQDLKDAFANFGVLHADTRGRHAILKFPNQDAAQRAVNEMNNTSLNGQVIVVREDRE
jgi:RNA recognition motif-containing protein